MDNIMDIYLHSLENNTINKNTLSCTKGLMNKIENYLSISNKDFKDFNSNEEVINFFAFLELKSKSSISSNLSIFKKFYNFLLLDGVVSNSFNIKISDLNHLVTETKDIKYVTKDELYDLMAILKNSQDKVILLLSYLGLGGNNAEEIRLLEITHVNFEKKLIVYNDKTFPLDYRDCLIIRAAINETEYEYYINSTSDYIIRTSEPLVTSNYIVRGVKNINGPLSYNSFKSRYVEYNKHLNANLSPTSLKHSMIAEKALRTQLSLGRQFSRAEIKDFLNELHKMNQLTIDSSRLYRIMNLLHNRL